MKMSWKPFSTKKLRKNVEKLEKYLEKLEQKLEINQQAIMQLQDEALKKEK